ncbi:hypothetical protein SCLCIDRAFT_1219035 [Scleroderma citrinum Foug A]|uniref:Uncharacterized protein n=1 Tax=Scleroderma citrinum Foug A TaxID=1036808 RepID=A0A0C2Z7N0_9AGAM|nr:hypothetical protein SCLCIDRAFT_1219035 [Scleroderma citrinum Foug A]
MSSSELMAHAVANLTSQEGGMWSAMEVRRSEARQCRQEHAIQWLQRFRCFFVQLL